jgi:hypothetical protein
VKALCTLPALFLIAITGLTAWADDQVTIEALVDGPSALHVRQGNIYWVNGNNAKPGRSDLLDEPTYVNGQPWKPHWKNNKAARGADKSQPFQIQLDSIELEFELLAVGAQRGGTEIEKRTPVTASKEGGEFVVVIPDPESGARWYKFVLRKKKP